jgi:hypothetical protein
MTSAKSLPVLLADEAAAIEGCGAVTGKEDIAPGRSRLTHGLNTILLEG